MTVRAAIGLGSNVGDRLEHLRTAVRQLRSVGKIVSVSSVYETEPLGGPKQADFLNAVLVVETELGAGELLGVLRTIEGEAGRRRRERWGPRRLDLDLLLYGSIQVAGEDLTVPHPRLRERRFVLEPLVEAWPEAALPDGTPLASLIDTVSEQRVDRVGDELRADR